MQTKNSHIWMEFPDKMNRDTANHPLHIETIVLYITIF